MWSIAIITHAYGSKKERVLSCAETVALLKELLRSNITLKSKETFYA